MTDNESSSQHIQVRFVFTDIYLLLTTFIAFQSLNFCCHLCGASYATRTCYWAHFQKCSSKTKKLPRKCQICAKEFSNDTLSVFNYHMRRCHYDIIKYSWFPCSFCSKLFPTEEVLEKHASQHFTAKKKKKEDFWLCAFCSHSESSEDAIIDHTQELHLDQIKVFGKGQVFYQLLHSLFFRIPGINVTFAQCTIQN